MISFFPILLAGLAAGAMHVLTGPDHLAAVAPMALDQRGRSWLLGIRWGLGHATGVILVAVLAWLFRGLFPIEAFSSGCERLVGVMLIGIGLWGLRKALRFEWHTHEHRHDGIVHRHLHAHRQGSSQRGQAEPHAHTHAALAVGILHGLAGGSHFLGVLPALAMPTKAAATFYLLSFGAGTIGAMAIFSFAIGAMGAVTGVKYLRAMMTSSAAFALLIGGYWLT